MMKLNGTQIRAILEGKGVRASYHRIRVYDYLLQSGGHPTAEEIYRALAEELPTLSRTTVYNSLNLFREAGMIMALQLADQETRYDVILEEHGHFRCLKCGILENVTLGELPDIPPPPGARMIRRTVLLEGVCGRCRESE